MAASEPISHSQRLVVGISGASGVIYGIRLLEILRTLPAIETHLILSKGAKKTIGLEADWTVQAVEQLADVVYGDHETEAAISSGSYLTAGMVVIPCAVKSLSAIAHSYDDTLLARAADVTLKERRRLVLVVRETPLHLGHLRLMTQVTEIGAIVMPPVPAMYHRPRTIDDVINQTCGRVLDLFGLTPDKALFERWQGPRPPGRRTARKDDPGESVEC